MYRMLVALVVVALANLLKTFHPKVLVFMATNFSIPGFLPSWRFGVAFAVSVCVRVGIMVGYFGVS